MGETEVGATPVFKRRKDEFGDSVLCDCCGYEATVVLYKGHKEVSCDLWLCEICHETGLSNAVVWPGQCPDSHLYRSVGWVANRILSAIEKIPRNGYGPPQ